MRTTYDVLVIGGGLAGCSAAIQLAEQGLSVLLLEKRSFPAHKLCGEFLSVEVQKSFAQLGILTAVEKAGAVPIRSVSMTSQHDARFEASLPGVALGLSRYELDLILARRAAAAGVAVREGVEVTLVQGTLKTGFHVQVRNESFSSSIVIAAYGRRTSLDRKLGRSFLSKNSPYVAFKAHFDGMVLPRHVELHAFEGGYCGISPVEKGVTNVCWIVHARKLKKAGGKAESMIDKVLSKNDRLRTFFNSANQLTSPYLAASQLTFSRKDIFAGDVLFLGDAAGMIAPMCGDGMAMALRSAELASPRVFQLLNSQLGVAEFKQQCTRAWDKEFNLRMQLGKWMHHAFCLPILAHLGLSLARSMPSVANLLINKTRDTSRSHRS